MKTSQFTLMSLAAIAAAKLDHNVANIHVQRAATTYPSSCVLTTTLPAITVTLPTGATSHMTKCPEPTGSSNGSGSGSGSGFVEPIVYVYTTVYKTVCPTGVVDKTYTLTKTCDTAPCTCTAGEVPSGFTVTVTTCTECGPAPVTATLTCPDEAHATIYATTKVTTAGTTVTAIPGGSGSGSGSGSSSGNSSGSGSVSGSGSGSASGSGSSSGSSSSNSGSSSGSGSSSDNGSDNGSGCDGKSCGATTVIVPTTGSSTYTTATSSPTSVVISSGMKSIASFGIAPLLAFIGFFWL